MDRPLRVRLRVGPRREAVLQLRKLCSSRGAIALRQRSERSVELRPESPRGRNVAKVNDRRTHGKRSEKLRALQRVGLVRQCREQPIHSVLPRRGALRYAIDRQPT